MDRNALRTLLIFACLLGTFWRAVAQQPDTLEWTLPEAEKHLLDNNLGVLAEQLQLKIADAEMVQAKVWPNPTLTIDNVNPYASPYQKNHAEKQAALFTKRFGQYRQVEVQLEQLVQLAGKRKKQQEIAAVSKQQAKAYLSEFLWNLKTEFRKTVYDYTFLAQNLQLLKEELASLEKIAAAYQKQFLAGNVNKALLVRLQSSVFQLKNDIGEKENEKEEIQAQWAVLLNLPGDQTVKITSGFSPDLSFDRFSTLSLPQLQQLAFTHRSDIRIAALDTALAQKEWHYERAMGVPDLTFSAQYDRGGGIYPDFWGLGVSIDLPFGNPNKGNIQKAQIKVQQESYRYQQHLRHVLADVRKKQERVLRLSQLLSGMDLEYVADLEKIMERYTENFKQQRIGIVEFMDFLETYIENKQRLFQNQRDFLVAREELKYAVGMEDLGIE